MWWIKVLAGFCSDLVSNPSFLTLIVWPRTSLIAENLFLRTQLGSRVEETFLPAPQLVGVTVSAIGGYFSRGATLTKVRLQSPSLQPGGSSPAITNAFRGEPGFVANTTKLWSEQDGSVKLESV